MGVLRSSTRTDNRGRIAVAAVLALPLLVSGCNTGSPGQNLESTLRPTPNRNVGDAGTMAPPQTVQPQTGLPQSGQSQAQSQAQLQAGQPFGGQAQTGQGQTGQGQQMAAVTGVQPIAFLPVSNIPQGAVTTLSTAIRGSAQRQGVPIVASVQQGAQYQVKGYFSALDDSGGTLLVYVWDVNDRNNKRVYRINGQEQTSAKSSDPWAAISPEMLNRVADNTLSQLKGWLATRR